jgi:hypothetical protein
MTLNSSWISAGSATALSFAALSLILISTISYRWFARDSVKVRISIFLVLLIGAGSVFYLVHRDESHPKETKEPSINPIKIKKSGKDIMPHITPKITPKITPISSKIILKNIDQKNIGPSSLVYRTSQTNPDTCSLYRIPSQDGLSGDEYRYRIICQKNSHVTFTSKKVIDPGYEGTRIWKDKNGDGVNDYCRKVGNIGNFEIVCTKGPNFDDSFYARTHDAM